MMNIHKTALHPYYKGVDTLSRSLNNCLYVRQGGTPALPCRIGVPRPELFYLIQLGHYILFNINKWSTTFNYNKNPRYKFIYNILIIAICFSLYLPTMIILPQFCISTDCTNGSPPSCVFVGQKQACRSPEGLGRTLVQSRCT